MNTEVELEIKNQLLKNNCQLKIFTKKSENITYICACGLEKKQMYADYIRRNCRNCNEKRMKDENNLQEEAQKILGKFKDDFIKLYKREPLQSEMIDNLKNEYNNKFLDELLNFKENKYLG